MRPCRLPAPTQGGEASPTEELANEKYVSALPLLPPLTSRTLNAYYSFYACFGAWPPPPAAGALLRVATRGRQGDRAVSARGAGGAEV